MAHHVLHLCDLAHIVNITSFLLLFNSAVCGQKTITFRSGRTLVANDGSSVYYNASYETSITTQYIDTWNYQNGMTYFWGSGDNVLSDGVQDKFRTLTRFSLLHKFLPDTSVVLSAQLSIDANGYGRSPIGRIIHSDGNLLRQPAQSVQSVGDQQVTFISWVCPVRVEVCFMTQPWDHLLTGARFTGTGWRFRGWNGTASVPWTQPGGWADCSPDVNISFVVPVNGAYGYVSQTINLDAGKVAGWLANNGSANFGLLFRAVNGSVRLVTGQWQDDNPALRRPSLSITYGGPATKPPVAAYPVSLGAAPRTWFVSTKGSDTGNSGHPDSPFKSPAKAVFEAWPGDKVYFISGVYPGGFSITRPGITLRSAPGEWAVISLPMDDPQSAVNVITLRPGADYGVISDLEIVGGFYYGIMFFTDWENYGAMADRVAKGTAPSHWLLQNLRIHDTGSSGVKLVMKARNNTFANCEMYNTGARQRTGGHGIEAVQAYDITVRDSYFHDIPGAAVHLAGGTARALLERNYVASTNFGFNLGFATDYEYMDPINNPKLYESINATARNNIITAVSQAGINVWASRGAVLAHNTLWQAQENAQSCILVNAYTHGYTPAGDVLTSSADLTVWANLLVRSATARAGPVLQIRVNGLDPSSAFVSAHNIYFDQKGPGQVPFRWGKGAMLEDERANSTFVGNATGWARHCTVDLNLPYSDINSLEADPKLDATFAPTACSPAKGRAAPKPPTGVALVSDDFSGRARPAGQYDAGAVQSNAKGSAKAIPPVPAAFAKRQPYTGVGLDPVYDKNWPYNFWMTRKCKDLYVDAINGTDSQTFNYDSNYTYPFKTIQAALVAINQCDRILLKGGQNHTGGFGIYRPNVTITTNPADRVRATVVCNSTTGTTPCIRTGDGFYGGAAAVVLSNFDVAMTGGASGSCIQFNEGAGSGTSAYWAFYLTARGLKPTLSYIQKMSLVNCGLHGIKLSTFVRGVVIRAVAINSPKGSGIEVRGGRDFWIQDNTILSPGDTAIRLGGGARNVVVERNLIRNFGGRGILLGSDNTEVTYMDVDWARTWDGDWHDNINSLVRNNILDGGAGAGVAFYSARDAVVVHNTLLNVAASMQAGVLLNVSPKQLGPTLEVGPPNVNITFKNNIVTLGGGPATNLMVEARILQGNVVSKSLVVNLPNGTTCPASLHHRRMLISQMTGDGLATTSTAAAAAAAEAAAAAIANVDAVADEAAVVTIPELLSSTPSHGTPTSSTTQVSRTGASSLWTADDSPLRRRQLVQVRSFADDYINTQGEQGRNADGSCPMFPADNAWHMDVTSLSVHPNSKTIKMNIGGGHLHPDFGGGYTSNGQRVLYGIPFVVVDSSKGTPMVPIDIAAYPDESDASPGGYPFPPNAPVEGAYPNCPDVPCGGDRHVLVVDNATCLLYETWRSFPPGVTGTGRWRADIIARFNLSRNAVGRPLGWTSSDAAGLAVLPGLVKWDEVVVRGVIDHAIRFTGPNSRAAYAPPATHFAPTGYTGPDAPYMGMRVRLNASYDCSPLAPAARVFCTALKKYGGIFADNGSPWYFSGEATSKWDTVLSQLYDIAKIPSSAMEVLDTGCLCLDAACTVAECNGIPDVDPSALPVYPAITSVTNISFANNIYYKAGSAAAAAVAGRYVDRRVPPPAGVGYDGGLSGWQAYTGGEAGSVEADPKLDPATYQPRSGSPANNSVPRLAAAAEDYKGRSRGPEGSLTDAGAVLC